MSYCVFTYPQPSFNAVSIYNSCTRYVNLRKDIVEIDLNQKEATFVENKNSMLYTCFKVASYFLVITYVGACILQYLTKPSGMEEKSRSLAKAAVEYLDQQSASLKENKSAVFFATRYDGDQFEYASPELKKDKGLIRDLIKDQACMIKYMDNSLQTDKNFLHELIKKNNYVASYVQGELKKNQDFVIKVLKDCADLEIKDIVDPSLLANKDFAKKLLHARPHGAFASLAENLKKDKEIREENKKIRKKLGITCAELINFFDREAKPKE